MTAAENTVQASKEVSELELRVQDLGDENRLLIEILNSNGVQFMDRLEAHRHKREFKRYCGKHPLGTTATAVKLVRSFDPAPMQVTVHQESADVMTTTIHVTVLRDTKETQRYDNSRRSSF